MQFFSTSLLLFGIGFPTARVTLRRFARRAPNVAKGRFMVCRRVSRILALTFIDLLAACKHQETAEASKWQVSYNGSTAAVNYASSSDVTLKSAVAMLGSCAQQGPAAIFCKNDTGWVVQFDLQSNSAFLVGGKATDANGTSPLGKIELTCQTPVSQGKATLCNQTGLSTN